MAIRPDISAGLLKVAREINQPRKLQTTLDTIVEDGCAVPAGHQPRRGHRAGRDGQMETKAGSDPFVWELDRLQYELREGPCVHVIGVDPVTTIEWAAHEQRWPRFMPLAVAKGLRSQIGMRLYTRRRPSVG